MVARQNILRLAVLAFAGVMAACATDTKQTSDQQLQAAQATLTNFQNDPEMRWFRDNLKNARGIIIAPRVTRGGFILGGSGGNALVFSREGKSSRWAGPAFYNMGTASVGFLAGVDVSEIIMLVMTDKAMDALLSSSFKVGGDASVAVGPVGAGAASTVNADMVSFIRSKGAYAGASVDGAVISPDRDANNAYYGKPVSPADILVRYTVTSPGGAPIQQQLTKPAK